jgi:small GTP-binding protein
MEELIKIVIAGLDNAGKTSILTALDKKYDFSKDVISITPTIRVEYHAMEFLMYHVCFWDMGGQKRYREIYQSKQDLYFAGTDLLVYVIDIQDKERYEESLNYLNMILKNFAKNRMEVPIIIAFHKYDPEIRSNEIILNDADMLRISINNKYPTFKVLYQLTSIFDIISIVQLISYGLSVFDERFFDLSELLESYLGVFKSKSLIIFDKNGIIISEFYNSIIEPEIYIEFLEGIKEHLFLLKRMQEESYETDSSFSAIGNELLSYLHKIKIGDQSFFVSVIIQEDNKEEFLEKFSDFLVDVSKILELLIKG